MRKYIDVVVLNKTTGEIKPLFIIHQGVKYKITHSICKGTRPSAIGWFGVQYIIKLENNKEALIYYDDLRKSWFIE